MKINKLMLALLAGAMFASCSDDRSGEPAAPGSGATSSGYMSIAIGMPAPSMSRANDNFDDGDKSEYTVNSIAIAFFEGREENAKFVRAYNVSKDFQEQNPENDQITSSNKVVFPVDVTETTESLWALALVNYSQVFTVDTKNQLFVNGIKDPFTGSIQDLMQLTTSKDLAFASGANFFMTNTPYTTSPGTGVTNAPTGLIHLLAPVDKEKIAETEDKAKLNPAAEIFVERAVAKVEVIERQGGVDDEAMPIKIKEIHWVIDNTEPSSYVIRNLRGNTTYDPTSAPQWMAYTQTNNFMNSLTANGVNLEMYKNYRFVGNEPFNYANPYYRLYFGVDPNGNGIDIDENGNVTSGQPLVKVGDNVTFGDTGSGNPQYCYENTFDVAHMDYANTTRVILKVTFDVTDGNNFYTRGIDRTTMYKAKDAQTTLASFVVEDPTVVKTWTDHFEKPTTITIENITTTMDEVNGVGTAKNEWLSINYKIENGRLVISGITLYDGNGNKIPFPDEVNVQDIIDRINSQVTFNAYEAGEAYYAVRIKHFGDDLTPWLEPAVEGYEPTTDKSYGTGENATKNYLGRYGVLRNNWYQLQVTSVSRFGEPTIGDLVIDKTPDDKVDPEKAISCKINILSWAKRSQNVDL